MSRAFRRWKLATLVIASPMFVAGVARAQGTAPLEQAPAIPFELASALLSSGGMAPDPRILVGSAPEWATKKIVVPKGATLVGSAFASNAVLAIVTIPAARDSVLDDLRKPLLALGWKVPPVVPRPVYGFVSAPLAPSTGPSARLNFCDQTQQMTVSIVRRDSKSADIAYRVFTWSGVGGLCNPFPVPPNNFRPSYPALFNPQATVDARPTGECNTANGSSSGTSTVLRTNLAPDALLDHYGKQLADSGWKRTDGQLSSVGLVFTKTDSAGTPLELTLTVATPPNLQSCHDVNMQVKTLRKP